MTHVAILDGARLAGVLTIEKLFSAPKGRLRRIMDPNPPVVTRAQIRRSPRGGPSAQESALAVVDEEGTSSASSPRTGFWQCCSGSTRRTWIVWVGSSEVRLRHVTRARNRRGGGFGTGCPGSWSARGALLSADIVGAFVEQIEGGIVLAFFIPGIVYLADAVGTQTETVVIRGLSVGVRLGQMAGPELVSGLLIGLALSSAFFPIALWRWGDAEVAIAVSLSLFAACSVATLIAMALPWAIRRLGKGPSVRQRTPGDGDTGPALDPHILHYRVMDRRMNIRNVRKGCLSRRRR